MGRNEKRPLVDIAEAAPNLVFIADPAGRFLYVNPAWTSYTGADITGWNTDSTLPHGILHPDDYRPTLERWKHSLKSGEPFEIQYRLRSAHDGLYRWFLVRAVPNRDENGAIVQWNGAATDIDTQVRASEGSRFLSEAASVVSSSLDEHQVLFGFARAAVQRFADSCVLVFTEGVNFRLGAFASRDPGFVPSIRPGSTYTPMVNGPVQQVARTRIPILKSIVTDEDIAAASHDEQRMAEIRRLEIRSFIAVPMVVVNRLIGVLCLISSDESRRFNEDDLDIAVAAARQLAIALENIRSFERFRVLGETTDQLFAAGETSEKLRRVLQIIVEEVADWAAFYAFGPNNTIRLQDIIHRDEEKSALLAEARGQRVFNLHSERQFYEALKNHRSMLRPKAGIDRLRETLKPYLVPVYASAMPQSMLTVPLFTGDQVYGALSMYAEHRSFGESDLELMQEVARRIALAFEHDESLERERRLTQTLQEVTLPAQLPVVPNALVSTVYMPAATSDAQLGGDWYDIFRLENGRYLLSIGDVTGRGLQASAIMGKLRHSINVVAMYEPDPARILDAAESVVHQRYPDAIATAFIALYDPKTASVTYANAGHPYPLLRMRDGGMERLVADGLPIGLRALDEPARSYTSSVDDAELLVMYTDGIVEANRDIESGERRLVDAVAGGAMPFVHDAASLIASLCLPSQAHDDAAILVLGFPKASTWMFQADHAKAATDARWSFVNQLHREGVDQESVDAAEIIFGELVANVVRHAPGAIDIALEWKDDVAVLHVIDRGPGFARKVLEREDPLRESGRGLWLVEQFGGTIEVERVDGFGTHVRVALPVRRVHADAPALAHN